MIHWFQGPNGDALVAYPPLLLITKSLGAMRPPKAGSTSIRHRRPGPYTGTFPPLVVSARMNGGAVLPTIPGAFWDCCGVMPTHIEL